MPLPDARRMVPGVLQHPRQGQPSRLDQRRIPGPEHRFLQARAPAVTARQDPVPRGGAHGGGRMGVGEADPLPGEPVEVRSLVEPAAVAAQIGPAHIVHDNKDDVGPFGRCCAGVFPGRAEAPVCRQGCEARTYCLEKVSPFHRLSSPDGTSLLCLFSFSGSYRRCGVRVVARVFLGGYRRIEKNSPDKQVVF